MTRNIFLAVYHSPLFPAHWGVWIPSTEDPTVGKIIQVTGDAATGFDHEFKRNYTFVGTLRKYSLILIATIEDKYVVDTPGDGSCLSDKDAVDDIERKALIVPAPSKSLVSASSQTTKMKVQILNCQTWVNDLATTLVANGIFPQEAITILANSPKN